MLERIVYVSRAAPGLGLEGVFGVIRESHARNALAGLSGGLIFLDGWFAQVLEGRPEPLGQTWRRIGRDPRHGAVALRARERALCRLFHDQPMALRTAACLPSSLLESFGYRPGFPVDGFPADVLIEFVVHACRPGARGWRDAGRLDRRGAVS